MSGPVTCLQSVMPKAYTWALICPNVRLRRKHRPSSFRPWLDQESKTHEKIYEVVWADADKRKLDANGKLPPVGDTVDVTVPTWSNTIGDPDLAGYWTDPDFDPAQPAFYYARIIAIPTPRWTSYDAARYSVKMSPEVPMKHQERAWTSPIWYTP